MTRRPHYIGPESSQFLVQYFNSRNLQSERYAQPSPVGAATLDEARKIAQDFRIYDPDHIFCEITDLEFNHIASLP